MFTETLLQVGILFIMIFIGVALCKAKILSDNGIKSMTDMVLTIVTPCVIIKSFIRPFEKEALKGLLISLLIALLAQLLFIIVSRIAFCKGDAATKRVLQFGVIFSNCGFMSLPLQQALLGDEGVFYGSSFIAVFNLLVWSYGITLMSGEKKYLTPKKIFINPGIIGITVGILVFLLSIPIPKIVYEPISYIASLNTPLPMIIIGFHLANSNLLKVFKNLRCLLAIGLRLIVLPALAICIMYLCGVRGTMLVSMSISCCAPIAAVTTMFSAKFGCNTELSVGMVSLSTLLSSITIPLIVTFAQHLSLL